MKIGSHTISGHLRFKSSIFQAIEPRFLAAWLAIYRGFTAAGFATSGNACLPCILISLRVGPSLFHFYERRSVDDVHCCMAW
ncbi:hypothetical protein ACROYT_G024931 [Oculina patagonica]